MVPESCINLFCDRLSKVPAPHSINHQKLFPLFDHIFKNFCSHVILHQKRRWNITIDLQKPSSLAVFNTCPLLPKISALDRDTFCLRVAKCANNIDFSLGRILGQCMWIVYAQYGLQNFTPLARRGTWWSWSERWKSWACSPSWGRRKSYLLTFSAVWHGHLRHLQVVLLC